MDFPLAGSPDGTKVLLRGFFLSVRFQHFYWCIVSVSLAGFYQIVVQSSSSGAINWQHASTQLESNARLSSTP